MADGPLQGLSRREREMMEIIYAMGRASVAEVLERLPDPPSYSAVRTTLRILEEKGHLVHEQEGPRYVYRPAGRVEAAQQAALRSLIGVFFRGSVDDAVTALLRMDDAAIPEERIEELVAEIENARKEGR